MNSAELNYQADINSLDTLKKIVVHLPVHMQAKGAEDSGKLLYAGIDPTFSHLTDVIEKRALAANTEFGKLVGSRFRESRVLKHLRKCDNGDDTVVALSQGASNQANAANFSRPKCN